MLTKLGSYIQIVDARRSHLNSHHQPPLHVQSRHDVGLHIFLGQEPLFSPSISIPGGSWLGGRFPTVVFAFVLPLAGSFLAVPINSPWLLARGLVSHRPYRLDGFQRFAAGWLVVCCLRRLSF